MFVNSKNKIYFGIKAPGDREATPAERAAWEVSRIPLNKIRELEAAKSDSIAQITRQALLMQTVAIALTTPAGRALTAGMNQEQATAAATAYLVSTDANFKLMYDLEQEIIPLRAQL